MMATLDALAQRKTKLAQIGAGTEEAIQKTEASEEKVRAQITQEDMAALGSRPT
jgi:hypothetical protein